MKTAAQSRGVAGLVSAPRKATRFFCVCWLLIASARFAQALTIIYPVEAIVDLWVHPADDFRAKYGGINITGLGPSDEGWYVRYRHENLTLLFGPLAEREDARKAKWELEVVRDEAIRHRASLASSQVDYVRFTYSGVYGKRGDGSGSIAAGSRISADGKSGPDGDLDGDGIPNALDDDMDGDGIPNAQDPDIDGDGIPNEKDDYPFGTNPDGTGGVAGAGTGKDGDTLAGQPGESGTGDTPGAGDGQQSAGGRRGGRLGGGSDAGDGSEESLAGESGQGGQKGKAVASSQRGNRGGSTGGQGAQGGQSGQSGQTGSQQDGGGSSGQSGAAPGQPGGSGPPSGGGGNPLSLLGAMLRMILGL